MQEVIQTTAIMDLLSPDTRGAVRADALSNPYRAASQIVIVLAHPRRTQLQREVLVFVRSRAWLSHHLSPYAWIAFRNDARLDACIAEPAQGTLHLHRRRAKAAYDAGRCQEPLKHRLDEQQLLKSFRPPRKRDQQLSEAWAAKCEGRIAFDAATYLPARGHFENAMRIFDKADGERRYQGDSCQAWAAWSDAWDARTSSDWTRALKGHQTAAKLWLKLQGEARTKPAQTWVIDCEARIAFEKGEYGKALDLFTREQNEWELLGERTHVDAIGRMIEQCTRLR